jgi:hypothetical protein
MTTMFCRATGFPISLILLAFAWLCPGATGDPAYYVRQGDWHDSMVASVEAIAGSLPGDEFEPFTSGVFRGGDAAQRISVKVAGARELFLMVQGCPDVKWAVADWADAGLVDKDGAVTRLVPGRNAEVLLGRCEKDLTLRSGLDQKLSLGVREFDYGLNVQAHSLIRVLLGGQQERFEAWIGVDGWAGTNGRVRFSVLGTRSGAIQQLFPLPTLCNAAALSIPKVWAKPLPT